MPTPESLTESNGAPVQSPNTSGDDKPWQFKKGQSGNPGGKPKQPDDDDNKSVPQALQDMRWVLQNGPRRDTTPGRKFFRKRMEESPTEFFTQLTQLEKAMLSAQSKEPPAPKTQQRETSTEPEPPDLGEMKAEALIEELLGQFEAEEAKQNAEFATRPDAHQIGASLQQDLNEALQRERALRLEMEQIRERLR